MIKAVSGPLNHPTVWFGLSGENITRLMNNEPILINLKELHPELPNVDIVLVGGKTENTIKEQLIGFQVPGLGFGK